MGNRNGIWKWCHLGSKWGYIAKANTDWRKGQLREICQSCKQNMSLLCRRDEDCVFVRHCAVSTSKIAADCFSCLTAVVLISFTRSFHAVLFLCSFTINVGGARGRSAGEKAQLPRKQMHRVRKQHIVSVPCGMQIVVSSTALGYCSSSYICVCPSLLNPLFWFL